MISWVSVPIEDPTVISELERAGVLLSTPNEYHITLRYFHEGQISTNSLLLESNRIARETDSFFLNLSCLGFFPDVLWCGVTPEKPLYDLHEKWNEVSTRLKIPPPDYQPYTPHITIAYSNKKNLKLLNQVQSISWEVSVMRVSYLEGTKTRNYDYVFQKPV